MNISKNLAAIVPLLSRLSEEIVSPVPQHASNPSIHQVSSNEKQDIRALTRDLRATLRDMEKALAVMQEAIEFVQTKKEKYTTSLEVHTSLLAPINDIPFEILSRIFSDVHDLDLERFHSGLTHCTINHSKEEPYCPTAPAITVAQVNHQWSQVALRTPALWSTLVFSADVEVEGQLISASRWVKRSEGSPLTCIILDHQVCGRRNQHRQRLTRWLQEPSLIPLLLPHLSRTRTLLIFGDYFPFMCRLRDENATLPCLETLQLDDLPSPMTVFDNGRSQELLGLKIGPLRSFTSFSGINLDHLTFDRRSLQLFKGILSDKHQLHKLPSLRRCRIQIACDDEGIRGLPAPPASHFLTVLWIDLHHHHSRDKVVGQLGHSLHLQSLVFRKVFADHDNYEYPGLLKFLQTSGGSLQYLSLQFQYFTNAELLRQFLECTPKLERLDCSLEANCVERFFGFLAEGDLVPHLCDLYLTMSRWHNVEVWTPEKCSWPEENRSPSTNRSVFNIKLIVGGTFAEGLTSEGQWEQATKSMADYYLPGCKTDFLWDMRLETVMFHGKCPGPDMDGLEEL